MQHFKISIFITILGLVAAFFWGGATAIVLTLMLGILEISLSFDNAVLNTTILQKMTPVWQQRFLTLGIFIAVFVVRFLLPVLIVSFAAQLSFREVLFLIFKAPNIYAQHLTEAKTPIAAFGGLFLFLVFLSFMFNQHKDIHWIGIIEKKLSKIGKIASAEILIALSILLLLQSFVPASQKIPCLIAGIIGILLFVLLSSLIEILSQGGKVLPRSGLIQFIYLEVLDASFSLDAVVGAFAITKDIVVILIGLTIGAVFVRSLTIFLARRGTLKKYLFLEHGAHYAIGALAVIMLLSVKIHVSEIITGLIGVVFIALSLLSSVLFNRKQKPQ